jgi:hypothetical protein
LSPPASLEAQSPQKGVLFYTAVRGGGLKTATPCWRQDPFAAKRLDGFQLPASQRQRKKTKPLCVLCVSAVKMKTDLVRNIRAPLAETAYPTFSKKFDSFFVGAASCRELIVAGSHSHKEQPLLP